jgi:phospholipid/cholesterol/gamma-HCH transport system permease protein
MGKADAREVRMAAETTTNLPEDGTTEAGPGGMDSRRGGDVVVLRLTGAWTIQSASSLEALLEAETARAERGPVTIDGSGLARLDTAGAWLIEEARRRMAESGRTVTLTGFEPAQAILLGAVEKIGRGTAAEPAPPHRVIAILAYVGEKAVDAFEDGKALLATLGEFSASIGAMLVGRRRMRWPAFVNHIDRTGLQAVPIVALMSFLIGMIIAQQGAFYMRTYGAEIFVVDLVAVLVTREIGVLLTAIMVAGRSGSAFTAEIGSMKMREEIDALTVLGVSPADVLVVPRLLALVLALPLLALIANLAALFGAYIVVVYLLAIPADTFLVRLREALTVTNLVVGIAKAPAMAVVIGLIACVEGLKVKGSAESLGKHTTASVVKAIFLVIVMDGVFAMIFASVGI